MAEKLTCDTCSRPLKRGHMTTVDSTFRNTEYTDAFHEEHHFCDVACLYWWGREQGERFGIFSRPRPQPIFSTVTNVPGALGNSPSPTPSPSEEHNRRDG